MVKFTQLLCLVCMILMCHKGVAKQEMALSNQLISAVKTALLKNKPAWLSHSTLDKLDKLDNNIKQNPSTVDAAALAIDTILLEAGSASPNLLNAQSLIYWQLNQSLPNNFAGVFSSKIGRYDYVRYPTPLAKLLNIDASRGDRLELIPSQISAEKHKISIKQEPLSQAKRFEFEKQKLNYQKVMRVYSQETARSFKLPSKNSMYIHLLDCSSFVEPTFREFIAAEKRNNLVILDLRDSYCESSLTIEKALTVIDRKVPIAFLQNRQTRKGAEDLIQNLRKIRSNILVLGEPSAGYQGDREAITLKDLPWSLNVTKNPLSKTTSIEPDFYIKDSFMFSADADDLLNKALSFLAECDFKS